MKQRAKAHNTNGAYDNPKVSDRMQIIPYVCNKISLIHKYIIAVFYGFYYPSKKVFYT